MIDDWVKIWDAHKGEIEKIFTEKHPDNYEEIVKQVVTLISKHTDGWRGKPDHEKITCFGGDDYQGTLLFVIPGKSYSPCQYWYVKVDYGSCSGCDTLQSIYSDGDWGTKPTTGQIKDYMMLALHILQETKELE